MSLVILEGLTGSTAVATLFPFGHGLGYTQFTYSFSSSQITVSKKLGFAKQCHNSLRYSGKQDPEACQSALISDILDCGSDSDSDISVEVLVKNVGTVDGSDVVMLYSKYPEGLEGAPIKHLVAFERVFVKAGERATVKFKMSACKSLAFVTETAYEVLPQGEHQLIVGDQLMSIYVQLQKQY